MRYNQENASGVEKREPEMTSVKSPLYVTFGIDGHPCADCPRTGHTESEACTAEPFSRSLNEQRNRAIELVTAAKINSE